MTSTLIPSGCPAPAPEPFTFPGIFRYKATGSLFIASRESSGIRLLTGAKAHSYHALPVGGEHAGPFRPDHYEQVKENITIQFFLP